MSKQAPTPKRGRPFLSDEDRREKRLVIKLNEAEMNELEQAGADKLRVWARDVLLAAARRSRKRA